jgi:hypothetical protein
VLGEWKTVIKNESKKFRSAKREKAKQLKAIEDLKKSTGV